MKRMATFLMLTAVIVAATPVMTNDTIEAMVSGGVQLPTIIRAIKTAPKIELYMNEREYIGLKNAGATTSEADEIFKAIHYREYFGIDRSPVEPVVRVSVEPLAVSKPAAPVPQGAPVPVPVALKPPTPVAPVVPVTTPPVPVPPAKTISVAVASVAPAPVSVSRVVPDSRVPASWEPPIPLPPSEGSVPAPALWAPPIPLPAEPGEGFGSPVAYSPALVAHNPNLLTDSEVTDAILKARLNGRHRIGLMLNDQQTAWGSVLASALANAACQSCPVQGTVSGYTIFVYSPEQWIEQMAVNARREMLPFTIDSVTPDMRVKMLHVVAMPSTPEYLNGTGFALSSSVHRIVITDTSRNDIVQPVQLANGSITTNSALRSAEFSTANAAFMMSDVERLRALDGKREFFITVTGSNQIKFFKVKEKFFNTLF
jgi:hypothetical protein